MQRSLDRILSTHVGSLIRPEELLNYIRPLQAGQSFDEAAYANCLKNSVAKVVEEQKGVGIDIPSDGEFGKFFTRTKSWTLI